MKTIEEQLSEALAQCKLHEASINELTTKVNTLTCDLQISSVSLDKKCEQLDAANVEIETLKATNADLQSKITTTEQKAAQIVANLGIPQEQIPASVESSETPAAIKARFKAMQPGPERSAFFKQHKDILF